MLTFVLAVATGLHTAVVGCPDGPDCNDTTVSPGLMGSGVVLLLGIGVFFLLRSFRKHVNRVPPTFDDPEDPEV
jgi:hypothetical protein